jgi:excinuclease ABC subunit C
MLRELADTFELPEPPKRIEVYDNSHIMGTNATGAMIVAGPEGFRKNSYRKFNIKRAGDPAGRRFRDDARGARAALRPAGEGGSRPLERRMARPAADRRRQGPAVGGVRDDGECRGPRRAGGRRSPRARTATPGARPSTARRARADLPPNSPCCSTSSGCATRRTASPSARTGQKRAKSLTTSTARRGPGIGPNRKRALLMHFGTARAVKGAALDDLERRRGSARRWRASSTIISTRAVAEHSKTLPTAHFVDLEPLPLSFQGEPLPPQPWRRARRLAQQAWSNALYERSL